MKLNILKYKQVDEDIQSIWRQRYFFCSLLHMIRHQKLHHLFYLYFYLSYWLHIYQMTLAEITIQLDGNQQANSLWNLSYVHGCHLGIFKQKINLRKKWSDKSLKKMIWRRTCEQLQWFVEYLERKLLDPHDSEVMQHMSRWFFEFVIQGIETSLKWCWKRS